MIRATRHKASADSSRGARPEHPRSHGRQTPAEDRRSGKAALALSWLDGDRQGATVLATARNMLQAQEAMAAVLPETLAHACRVARMDRQQLTLAVPSAAYASKLRQLAPRIVQHLNQRGWVLQDIRVQVQAGLFRDPAHARQRDVMPLDNAALQAFDDLRASLAPGPLASAVEALLRHHRL